MCSKTLRLKMYLPKSIEPEGVSTKKYWAWRCIYQKVLSLKVYLPKSIEPEGVSTKRYWAWRCIYQKVLSLKVYLPKSIEPEGVSTKKYWAWRCIYQKVLSLKVYLPKGIEPEGVSTKTEMSNNLKCLLQNSLLCIQHISVNVKLETKKSSGLWYVMKPGLYAGLVNLTLYKRYKIMHHFSKYFIQFLVSNISLPSQLGL